MLLKRGGGAECCLRHCTTRRTVSYKASGPDASGMYDASYSVVQGVGARRVGDVPARLPLTAGGNSFYGVRVGPLSLYSQLLLQPHAPPPPPHAGAGHASHTQSFPRP